MTDLENNQKIRKFMDDKVCVDRTNEQINKRYLQIDDLIYALNGKPFSYETHNYHKNNKPFFEIDTLRREIKHFETMLSKEQELLKNSEEKARGLEWTV